MNNYRVGYKDYFGEYKHVYISAKSEQEAKERFEYEYGDCKLLYVD